MKKLKLKDLQLNSFVTSLDKKIGETIIGARVSDGCGPVTKNQNCPGSMEYDGPCANKSGLNTCQFATCFKFQDNFSNVRGPMCHPIPYSRSCHTLRYECC